MSTLPKRKHHFLMHYLLHPKTPKVLLRTHLVNKSLEGLFEANIPHTFVRNVPFY